MNEPREQPPSEIWSRWRRRRAARALPEEPTAPPTEGPPASESEPGGAAEPEPESPGAEEATAAAGSGGERPEEGAATGFGRYAGYGEGAGFERGTAFGPGAGARHEPGTGFEPGPEAGHFRAADGRECLEWCPICRTADVVRASVPPEIRAQWHDVQREALVTVRAMIDHYISRLEDSSSAASSRVEDIPIE